MTSNEDSLANSDKYDIEHRIVLKGGVEKWVREISTTVFKFSSFRLHVVQVYKKAGELNLT
ncbi:MAG: hypothetical protein U9Q58_10160 [Pseudomonadota bacterium]|nr:hypothetical protein [Pseudomonadota bacterium]